MTKGTLDREALRRMQWAPVTTDFEVETTDYYPDLSNASGRPTEATLRHASSPLGIFFIFVPKALWIEILVDLNQYRLQQFDARVRLLQRKQKNRHALDSRINVERVREIKVRLWRLGAIQQHELVIVVAILLANVPSPLIRGIYHH